MLLKNSNFVCVYFCFKWHNVGHFASVLILHLNLFVFILFEDNFF